MTTSFTPSPGPRTVRVELDAGRSYEVVVGAGVLAEVRPRLEAMLGGPRRAFLVHDRGVPKEHLAVLSSTTGRLGSGDAVAAWTPTEQGKSLQQAGEFLSAMAAAHLERTQPVIALGGGITGDVAGFVAGVYKRAVPWVNCPTTLLAMVDASVGGKTGVNLQAGGAGGAHLLKNMVGVFHQPRLVVADVRTLRSLPEREMKCGLAECVKHGLLAADWGDAGLLEWVRGSLAAIHARDEGVLTDLVARNVTVKAKVVMADERESGDGPGGGRMALNLGHTFAHAFEGIPELGLAHGEAVGLGLLAAATCSHKLGMTGTELRLGLEGLLGPAGIGLPTRAPGLPPAAEVIALMHEDKKVERGSLRLILPVEKGRVRVVKDPPADAVRAAIDSLR